MAKPILILRTDKMLNPEESSKLRDKLTRHLLYEYHVIIAYDETAKQTQFETLNDIKGLKDTDIEKLIDKYTELWQGQKEQKT